MRNASVNYVQYFVMSPLLVELLDKTARNVDDLDNSFALKMARFDLEVLHSIRAIIVGHNLFEYHFI